MVAAAGAVILPAKSGFPGVDKKAKGAVFFATAGEQGVLKVWRSDTGQCLYRHRCAVLTLSVCHAAFTSTLLYLYRMLQTCKFMCYAH
jgi:hypothetical protein